MFFLFFFFKQKTAYEMRISDWSSDVCSSDLEAGELAASAGYTYQSRVSFQDANLGSALAFQKGYSLLDARLGLNRIGGTNINASVFAKNITNEAYAVERQDLVSAFGFAGTIYNDPRTYGLEISYKFGGRD